jgi:hypothetical protein
LATEIECAAKPVRREIDQFEVIQIMLMC